MTSVGDRVEDALLFPAWIATGQREVGCLPRWGMPWATEPGNVVDGSAQYRVALSIGRRQLYTWMPRQTEVQIWAETR